MRLHLPGLLGLLQAGRAIAQLGENEQAEGEYPGLEVISRDVAIVGGGASGTYAAIKLRDMNYTVSLIERGDRLGGHTETYIDPDTGTPVDYGVQIFHNSDITRRFFDRFGVPLTSLNTSGAEVLYFDFSTGKRVNYTTPDATAAFQAYLGQLDKYPYLQEGFDLPDPVPTDLLLPFGEFIRKYELDDLAREASRYGQGIGHFLELPTIYVLKFETMRDARSGFLTTARHNNSEIYSLALSELGSDVHLQSSVLSASYQNSSSSAPGGHPVRLVTQTPSGTKVILAKKLLIAIPPTPENLRPFSLDSRQQTLFSRFRNSYYFTGILKNTGIDQYASIQNVDPTRPYAIADIPGAYYFVSTRVPGMVRVTYAAPARTSVQEAQAGVVDTLQRLRGAGDLQFSTAADAQLGFLAFADHSPYELVVSADEIENGFYRELYALQGHRDTWWTGAAWHTHDTSPLWQFTEGVVGRLVEGL
ncbi:putative FAD dependent oxidoreductase [Macrophomina phaseolina]|uniref:FAD dependent oxidoreductase n=1 Tax=Macrophomina phaseolina TaxID=35725 RepID=A0ABQ8FUH4_9PEZI|nr:putative FAD dependent oxidoreductase [Macrophomina phaseolina]